MLFQMGSLDAKKARSQTLKKNKKAQTIIKDINKKIKYSMKNGCNEVVYIFAKDDSITGTIQQYFIDKEFHVNAVDVPMPDMLDSGVCKYRIYW